MIKLKQILNEMPITSLLYHFTQPQSILKILKEDILRASADYGNVSFTRNKNLTTGGGQHMFGEIRITFDRNKLNNKYKIIPFKYGISSGVEIPDENEEIIEDNITFVKKYIINITVYKKEYNYWWKIHNPTEIYPFYLTYEDFLLKIKKNKILIQTQ